MNSTTVLVVVMGLLMTVAGIIVARMSKRNRAAGVAIAALGIMFTVGYFVADDTAPLPGSGTPTPELPFTFPNITKP